MLLILAGIGTLLGGLAFALGLGLGQELESGGDEKYVRFATRSHFAYNIVDPLLFAARAFVAYGENVPMNFLTGLTARSSLKQLVIDIKHEDYAKLARKRDEAIRLGALVADNNDYVPATLTLDGVEARAKVRLKGDLPDHFRTEKWSLRVKIRGDNTLAGMERFSIQHPGTRNFIGEWVLFRALEKEDVITPRYQFVEVTINGNRKGVYALEEHFDKRLLEHRRRREGPIMKFNEDLIWKEMIQLNLFHTEYGSFHSSAVDGFTTNALENSEFERAANLLEGFRRGDLPTTSVFDSRKLAIFVAMREVSGAPTIRWQNLRFYYNPVTSKLEPIAYDNEVFPNFEPFDLLFSFAGGISDKRWPNAQSDNLMELVFADPDFTPHYVEALERVAQPDYFGPLFEEIGEELRSTLGVIHKEYPYASWSTDFLEHNQRFIREALAAAGAIRAHSTPDSRALHQLYVANLHSLPIEVTGVSKGGGHAIPLPTRMVMPPRVPNRALEYRQLQLTPATRSNTEGDRLILHYRVAGLANGNSVEVRPDSWRLPESLEYQQPSVSLLAAMPFLRVSEQSKTIIFVPGDWKIDEDIVFPAGYRVFAGPGVRLDLRRRAKLISHSPLDFLGSPDEPIVVGSTDSSGAGLIVVNAGSVSHFRYIVFENLGRTSVADTKLRGAVTFVRSPLDIESAQLRRNGAPFALAVVGTTLRLKKSVFSYNQSDLSIHSSKGILGNVSFVGTRGDATHAFASTVEAMMVRVEDVSGTALNAEDGSQLVIEDCDVRGAAVAASVLGQSTLTATIFRAQGVRTAFRVSGSSESLVEAGIHISNLELSDVEWEFESERGAKIPLSERIAESVF